MTDLSRRGVVAGLLAAPLASQLPIPTPAEPIYDAIMRPIRGNHVAHVFRFPMMTDAEMVEEMHRGIAKVFQAPLGYLCPPDQVMDDWLARGEST